MNGKEACVKFALCKCNNPWCKYFDGCLVPLQSGTADSFRGYLAPDAGA